MSIVLFPRLDSLTADSIIQKQSTSDSFLRPDIKKTYAASGGSPIENSRLDMLASEVREIAAGYGFPEKTDSEGRSSFDTRTSIFFAENSLLKSPEMLRDDVWAYITTILLPDIVLWRFSELTPDRFHGGVRNTLQRLYMRSQILDRGYQVQDRWELVEKLTEDALVQIIERPSIGANQRLACAIAESWIRTSDRIGKSAMEPVMRRAIIRIRIRNQVQALEFLNDRELSECLDLIFARSSIVD